MESNFLLILLEQLFHAVVLMLNLISLVPAEWLFHLFALAVFVKEFYSRGFPFGKTAFAVFAFFFFPAFNAGKLIGITMFNVQHTLIFFGFIVIPAVIFLSYTKFAGKTPVIVLSLLFLLTALSLIL